MAHGVCGYTVVGRYVRTVNVPFLVWFRAVFPCGFFGPSVWGGGRVVLTFVPFARGRLVVWAHRTSEMGLPASKRGEGIGCRPFAIRSLRDLLYMASPCL